MTGGVSPVWLGAGAALRERYRGARPFEHLILDGFLTPELCAAVSAEFPPLKKMRLAEYGEFGRRAIYRDLAAAGPSSKTLDRELRSAGFLRWLSGITGLRSLVRNPDGTCGGLFQDAHGLELDPHLDVNCTVPGLRRRLTLLLYLNAEWKEAWGGALQLSSGPSRPPSKTALPLSNRAVLMASHEGSWHGVTPIDLPPGRRALGRRTLIVNFYGPAKARGDAPAHFNVWMPRPLPAHLRAGRALTREDAAEIRRLLARRDGLIRELRFLEASRKKALPAPAAPLSGRVAAGYTLTRADQREISSLFSSRDRELRRLYSLEHEYRRIV